MARNREVRKWQKINRELRLFGLGAVLVLLGFGWLTTLYFRGGGTPDVALAPGEDLRLALAELDLGRFHFFRLPADSAERLRVVARRESDGVVRVAFDSCRRCFSSGLRNYVQQGELICRHCGHVMPLQGLRAQVEREKDCAVEPLPYLLENGQVMLRAETLQDKAKNFLASVRVEAP